jgi:hypothetical protein
MGQRAGECVRRDTVTVRGCHDAQRGSESHDVIMLRAELSMND